jgi:CRP/FNR family transcriptional regulator, cyclic AMP receptor protein
MIIYGSMRLTQQRPTDVWEIVRGCRSRWPRTSFLAGLEISVLRDFVTIGELVRFRKGEALLNEGATASDVFLLLDASVKVTARLSPQSQALLAIRADGDIIGEIAVMDGGERTATVRACGYQPNVTMRVDQDDLRSLLIRHPEAATSLAQVVSRRLRTATRRRVETSNCTSKVRMARAVLELAENYSQRVARGTLISVNLTQVELGTFVGVGETTAQRALRALRSDGLIGNSGRRLLVPDVAALRSAAWPS